MRNRILYTLVFMSALLLSTMATAAELVNLNKADAAAMQQNLVGIGVVKAEAIVGYRNKNGKYKSINDLENVKGIGPALIKKNKRLLSLSKGVVKGDAKKYAASKKAAKGGKSTTKKKSTKKKTTASKKKSSSTKSKSSTSSSSSKKKSKKKKKKAKATDAAT